MPESFFNKVAGAVCNFIKKETLAEVKYAKFLRTLFYRTHPVAASGNCKTKEETQTARYTRSVQALG